MMAMPYNVARCDGERELQRREGPMPHVTNFRFKAKPGQRQAVIDTFQRWEETRKAKAKGFMRSVLSSNVNDPDEFMAGVMFDTTENYNANSNDPEQGAWFQELRSLLMGDPDWFNGNLERQLTA
jgi:quinol monooxygenase YgiN